MAVFGSVTGRTYPLGRINIHVPGTPALLSQNVPLTQGFGVAGSLSPTVRCSQIVFKSPGPGTVGNITNTGQIYVCYKGGNRTIQNSILYDLDPGAVFVMGSGAENSNYDPTAYVLDADNVDDGCRVFLILGT